MNTKKTLKSWNILRGGVISIAVLFLSMPSSFAFAATPSLFTVAKSPTVAIEQGKRLEIAEIKVRSQKEDTFLNTVIIEVSPSKKYASVKPWEVFDQLTINYKGEQIYEQNLTEETYWKKTKNKNGGIVYRIEIYEGNHKIKAGKGLTLSAHLSVLPNASVESVWKITIPKDGVVVWTKKSGHRTYTKSVDVARVTIAKKFNEFDWMREESYRNNVIKYLARVESNQYAAERAVNGMTSSAQKEYLILLNDAQSTLASAYKALDKKKYEKALDLGEEADTKFVFIKNTAAKVDEQHREKPITITFFESCFGMTNLQDTACERADLNKDGAIDMFDLSILDGLLNS